MEAKIKLISILIPYYQTDNQLNLWVQQREGQDDLAGLLEFPGGKMEAGESSFQAAQRETLEEVGVEVELSRIERLASHEFAGGLTIFIHLYEDSARKFAENGYFELNQLLGMADQVLPNNKLILGQIKQYFEEYKA